jgi:hypothetical protein
VAAKSKIFLARSTTRGAAADHDAALARWLSATRQPIEVEEEEEVVPSPKERLTARQSSKAPRRGSM